MKQKFEEKNLEKCIASAEEELSLSRNDFKYTVLEEEKSFLKKHCVILVETKDDEIDIPEIEDLEKKMSDIDKLIPKEEEDKSNDIQVKDNRILIIFDSEEEINLEVNQNINLFVNDEKVSSYVKVTAKDQIKYEPNIVEGKREFNLKFSSMEAKVSIRYTPEFEEKLMFKRVGDTVSISSRMVKKRLPPFYTKQEITGFLKEKNIVSGYIDSALDEASTKELVDGLVVAEGKKAIDDEDDKVEILFEKTKRIVAEDSKEKVDYRNLYSIANVSANTILAELKKGKEGTDGLDIFGKEISKKLKKNLQLKVGNGCKIEDGKVIATIEGQPTVKSGVFFVHQVFQAPADVDLKSGNINFIGDVKIVKNVLDGMIVEAGNTVTIGGNVESATVIAQGETRINGSIINSTIHVGSRNLEKQSYLEDLNALLREVKMLITYSSEIKNKNILGDRSDGEIIKVLIETKFKTLPKKALALLNHNYGDKLEEIKNIIRTRLLGLGPLNIKCINDIYKFVNLLEQEIEPLSEDLIVPVDVYINYAQDSEIKATGNVYIIGKGQYTSNITAAENIIFTVQGAISRGGVLSAKGNIEAKVVGSVAGVSTILKVLKDGIITADVAYNNTTFTFGERSYTLDEPSKNIKAYVDKSGEIVVEKLRF